MSLHKTKHTHTMKTNTTTNNASAATTAQGITTLQIISKHMSAAKSNGDVSIQVTVDDGDVTLHWDYTPTGPDSAYETTATINGPSAATIAEVRTAGRSADLSALSCEAYDAIHSVVHRLRREIGMDVTDGDKALITEALVEALCG